MANSFRPMPGDLPSKTVLESETSAVEKGAGEKKKTCSEQRPKHHLKFAMFASEQVGFKADWCTNTGIPTA